MAQFDFALSYVTAPVGGCWDKAGRKRVFLLLARDGFSFPDSFFGGVCAFSTFPDCLITPGFEQQENFDFSDDVDVNGQWNAHNQVPIENWLNHTQSQQDTSRLKCMGNIVVPIQAYQASKLLARMGPLCA